MNGWRRRRRARVAPEPRPSRPSDVPIDTADVTTDAGASRPDPAVTPEAPEPSSPREADEPTAQPTDPLSDGGPAGMGEAGTAETDGAPTAPPDDEPTTDETSAPTVAADAGSSSDGRGRLVHSSLARPRRRSTRDDQLDLEAAEREAAAEALFSAGDEEEAEPSAASTALEPLVPVATLAGVELSPAEIEAATRRAIEQLPGRSARLETCPFLRSIAAGNLQPPRDSIDGRNRCAALPDPLPLSRTQQGLVCLHLAHTRCPRYLRGVAVIQEQIAPTPPRRVPLPTLVAAALLALTIALVALYGMSRGGFGDLPSTVPSTSPPAAVASPTVTPAPQPSPTARVTASPAPTRTPRPTPLPIQWRGLQRCGGGQECFIYRVRRGDALELIAETFRTTVADLRRLNPGLEGDDLRVGQRLRVPPP